MGGSKSSSKSASTTSTNTRTDNLNLDGVEGVVVSGSAGANINVTSDGAFSVVSDALNVLEASQAKALQAVGNTTIKSLEKVNQSNLSDKQQTLGQITQFAGVMAAAFVAYKVWGK